MWFGNVPMPQRRLLQDFFCKRWQMIQTFTRVKGYISGGNSMEVFKCDKCNEIIQGHIEPWMKWNNSYLLGVEFCVVLKPT